MLLTDKKRVLPANADKTSNFAFLTLFVA